MILLQHSIVAGDSNSMSMALSARSVKDLTGNEADEYFFIVFDHEIALRRKDLTS